MTKRCLNALSAILPVVVLAACSGGSGGTSAPANQFGPEDAALGTGVGDVDVTYDQTTDTVVLRAGGVEKTLSRTSGVPANGPLVAYDLRFRDAAILGSTPSGQGEARVLVVADQGIAGSRVSRLGQTDMPVSGTASYDGAYAALITDATGNGGYPLHGQVKLDVDFEREEISGRISDRVNSRFSNIFFDDVIIPTTSIENGGFEGSVTGGNRSSNDPNGIHQTVAGPGEMKGLFVGPDGGEIVGAVEIPHSRAPGSPPSLTERGVFVAD